MVGAGAAAGLLLVGSSEVICLLDQMNKKIWDQAGKTERNTAPYSISGDEVETLHKTIIRNTSYRKDIPTPNKRIVEKYLKAHGISFNEIFDTPYEGFYYD